MLVEESWVPAEPETIVFSDRLMGFPLVNPSSLRGGFRRTISWRAFRRTWQGPCRRPSGRRGSQRQPLGDFTCCEAQALAEVTTEAIATRIRRYSRFVAVYGVYLAQGSGGLCPPARYTIQNHFSLACRMALCTCPTDTPRWEAKSATVIPCDAWR